MRRTRHFLHTLKHFLPAAALAVAVGCADGGPNGLTVDDLESMGSEGLVPGEQPGEAMGTVTQPQSSPAVPDQLEANFDGMQPGAFGAVTQPALETELGRTIAWANEVGELSVVNEDQGRSLRQRYAPTNSGSRVVTFPVTLPGAEELWLSYRVLFEPGWQHVLGGKLPGLAGGTFPTGGDFDPDGFSARMMWREGGTMSVYAYHHDRPEKWGEDFFLVNENGSRWEAPIGQWLTVRQRIKMNSSGQARDGEVEVWIDGERRLLKTGLRWRDNTGYSVDRFLYSSFYGGSDASWAPTTTTYARFDDIKVASSANGVD